MRNQLAASLFALVFVGCGGAEPAPNAPAPPESPPPAPSTIASATPVEPKPVVEPDPEHIAPQSPLSPPEQAEVKSKCAPLGKAIEKAAAGASGPPFYRAYEAVKAVGSTPIAGMKDDVRLRCAELLERDIKVYVVSSLQVAAIGNLGVLAHLVDQAVARGNQPCPSAPAVPRSFAALAKGAYTPSGEDYGGAGWKCLENASILDNLMAQIRVASDASAKTVTLVARTMPFRDGKMVEYVRVGHVDGPNVKWDKPETH